MPLPFLGDATCSGALTVAGSSTFNGTVQMSGTTNLLGRASTATSGNVNIASRALQWQTSYWNGAAAVSESLILTGVRRSVTPGDQYLAATGDFQASGTVTGAGVYDGANQVYSLGNKVPVAGISATGTASSSTYLRGDGSWAAATSTAAQPQMLSLYQATAQTIPNVTDTIVTFDATDQNQSMTGVTFSNGVFTVVETGVYYISASLRYAANGAPAGERYVSIGPAATTGATGYNTATPSPAGNRYGAQGSSVSSTTASQNINTSASRYLVAGDTFAVWTYQSQGTSLLLDTSFKTTHVNVTKLSGAKGDTGASGTGANGEVASYTGPPTNLAITGAANTTAITVTWNSIAGHRYKITGYMNGDSDATAATVDVHFDLPGQGSKYMIYSVNTSNIFLFGGATGEFTETATQTRTLFIYMVKVAGTFTVRANTAIFNVEDITPGSSLLVAPSSTAPAQNVVAAQVLGSGAVMSLTGTPVAVPSATYTIPVSGSYLVNMQMDAIWATNDTGIVGEFYLDGVVLGANRTQAFWFGAVNGARATVTATQVITATAGQVLTLRVMKNSGTGGSQVVATSTGFTVLLPGTGNLDSDALNLMGAL